MPSPSAIIWKLAGLLLLVVALGVQTLRVNALKHDVASEKALHAADIALWRGAGVLALTRAKASKAATEARYAQIGIEAGNDTQNRMDALRRALAGRVRPSAAGPGSASGAGLPISTASAVDSALATDATVLSGDDARRCGEAWIVATGWQAWWRSVESTRTGEVR